MSGRENASGGLMVWSSNRNLLYLPLQIGQSALEHAAVTGILAAFKLLNYALE